LRNKYCNKYTCNYLSHILSMYPTLILLTEIQKINILKFIIAVGQPYYEEANYSTMAECSAWVRDSEKVLTF